MTKDGNLPTKEIGCIVPTKEDVLSKMGRLWEMAEGFYRGGWNSVESC